jgi:putative transposase
MPEYRRSYVPGGTYFFTLVTEGRRPFLTDPLARKHLREAMAEEFAARPVEVVAIVLLPDHLHTIWTLPPGDSDYSLRWKRVKELFTRAYLAGGGAEGAVTPSRRAHQGRAVWQRRFWEHTIRDADDLERCVNYIHWNPVKHGLVQRVRDYPWSSFHRFVEAGDYDLDWGAVEPETVPGAEWE